MASSTLSSNTNQQEGIDGGMFTPNDQNVLQKHVAFFDRNHDGVVYPWETFKGFRAIGCGILLSAAASLFINAGLSSKTRPGKWPSPLFPIEIKNIHKAKHGSDSGVYDHEGRFVPAKFEDIFRKHAHKRPESLTSDELSEMLKANREPKDIGGWLVIDLFFLYYTYNFCWVDPGSGRVERPPTYENRDVGVCLCYTHDNINNDLVDDSFDIRL